MTEEEINEKWKWIETEILLNIKKNNANDSLDEIREFLYVKFDRLFLFYIIYFILIIKIK